MQQSSMARRAYTYDAPHVLRHIEAYLTAFMDLFKKSGRIPTTKAGEGPCAFKDFMKWAVMAEKFDMHELHGHCERAMMTCWEYYQDRLHLLDKLSCSALQRVAKGLNRTLLAAVKRRPKSAPEYPAVKEVIAWGQHK